MTVTSAVRMTMKKFYVVECDECGLILTPLRKVQDAETAKKAMESHMKKLHPA